MADLTVTGAYSEYIYLPESRLVPVPDDLDAGEAVSLILSYVTAYQMLYWAAKIGLHYEGATAEDVQPHIEFLQSRHVKLVALSPHDSSEEAHDAFQAAFQDNYHTLRVGEAIQFP